MQINRRTLLFASAAAALAHPVAAATLPGEPFAVSDQDQMQLPYWFRRQMVDYPSAEPPGSIIVSIRQHYLWLILGNGKAARFGIGTGKYGDWTGQSVVGRLEKWPIWTPTKDHLTRRPDLIKYIKGMPGGLENPMGARAIYLYQNNVDTTYRIHGTDAPQLIGAKATAGCISLLNADVIWLYDRVKLGARVVILKDQ